MVRNILNKFGIQLDAKLLQDTVNFTEGNGYLFGSPPDVVIKGLLEAESSARIMEIHSDHASSTHGMSQFSAMKANFIR